LPAAAQQVQKRARFGYEEVADARQPHAPLIFAGIVKGPIKISEKALLDTDRCQVRL
jgi:hypothetical protein